MFPYDPALLAAVRTPPQSVADVLRIMQTIEATCIDGDGLKWFNWLYLQVTQAVETRIAAGDSPIPHGSRTSTFNSRVCTSGLLHRRFRINPVPAAGRHCSPAGTAFLSPVSSSP